MKIYLAEASIGNLPYIQTGANRIGLPVNLLMSYYFYNEFKIDELMKDCFTEPFPGVFADSGAYSAFIKGETIDVYQYGEWLHENKGWFDAYANLDVKHYDFKESVRLSQKNQVILEGMDLSPLPVFHGGEDFGVLKEYAEQYDYVALGGVAGGFLNNDLVTRWLVQCFRVTEGRVKFHAFGMTSLDWMKRLPLYSVDSSSWGGGYRWGMVPVFDPKRFKLLGLKLGNKKDWQKHSLLVKSYNQDPIDYADRQRNTRQKLIELGAASYAKMQDSLTRLHKS